MYALLLALLLGSARAAAAQAQDVGSVTVNSTRGLAMALNNTAVSQIYLNDTLTLVGAEWPGVVSIADGRAVKLSGALQAQPQVYVSLNWANLTGIIWLAPSASLVFEGLEISDYHNLTQSYFLPFRASPGAFITARNCILRRRVGLSVELAIISMRAADRPPGVPGPQLCQLYPELRYNYTAEPGVEHYEAMVIQQTDVQTVLAPYSPGGSASYNSFQWSALDCFYFVDHPVDQSCLNEKPGAECLADLIRILDGITDAGGSGSGNKGESYLMTVVVAVVLPGSVILLAISIAAGRLGMNRACEEPPDLSSRPEPDLEAANKLYGGMGMVGGSADGASGRGSGGGGMRPSRFGGGAGGGRFDDDDEGGLFLGLNHPDEPLPAWRPTEPYVDDDPKGGSAGAGGSAGGGNGGASKGVEGEDSLPSNSEGSRTPDSVAPPLVPQPDGGAADVAASGADGSVRGGSAPVHQSLVITLSAEQVARMHRAAMANGNMASRPVAAGAPPAEIQEGSGGDSVTGENASAGNRAAPAGARGAHGAGADVGAGAPDPGGRARQQPEPGAAGPAAAAHATAAGAGAGVGVGAGADGAGRGGGRASPTGPATPAGANTAVTAVGGPGGGPAAAVQAAPAPSAPPQPAPPARDVPAELLEMSKAVRCSVQDVAIQMEAVIGAGSFGVVYKGTWQGLTVAIKTVVFSATTDHRRSALKEAALASSVVHPNIIATYCSELQSIGGHHGLLPMPAQQAPIMDWRLYIVQEYADGGALRSLYGRKDIWPAPGEANMPAVLSLGYGIARAITHLHTKRIVHGDLNPNNVLLKRNDAEPSGYTVKVGDFGLSVMLPQHVSHLSNMRMGTMFYMCPAVLLKAQVGPASDVFSLGVVLWELFNGQCAGRQTPEGPRYVPTFPAFPPTCPAAYRKIALSCLQKQPANRPTASQVEQQLEVLLATATCSPEGPQRLATLTAAELNRMFSV
ncbi:hypothetical protein CHLRE_02g087900v5 [Chlamydomonas reinhardtii]|uniref:Protein kinase domain-containing protein n=1 Tax=Chlamydomonas reinhardtii TaxID=3055 RepID=A0A2K3E110_CHLRE|nr:uncharacterized protein CHLRE_02g087900v5 [Chlamydomonas reinhardtii]PNW86474.1 hypothetical protein CHLRE_02g087900v5 [Chlamydomonas reinhardtii]